MSDSPFKAYDVRGRVGENLDEEMVYALGRAVATLDPGDVVVGHDIRESSAPYAAALAQGLSEGGAGVIAIGLCGTEEVYFATDHFGAGAGVMVTASHNPIDYNGMKLVGAGAKPLPDALFRELEKKTLNREFGTEPEQKGIIRSADPRAAFVTHVTGLVDVAALPPVKIVANPGNGCAGPTFEAVVAALIAKGAKIEVVWLHHDPDGSFPNGIPNPLLPENQPVTAEAVRAAGADLGLAWDGDFDRCFFFDAEGTCIAGEYMVGVIAQAVLAREPGAKIVHDPRVIWNTLDVVAAAGGQAVVSKTGHALVKAAMREAGAAYGGEMSAHHYFRDFMYCDSGMIPWLMVLVAMGQSGGPLSDLVSGMRARFPSSGEINFRVRDAKASMAAIEAAYASEAKAIDLLDGLSLDMGDWRLNLRMSNTEPLLRLNVEARGDGALLAEKVAALSAQLAKG